MPERLFASRQSSCPQCLLIAIEGWMQCSSQLSSPSTSPWVFLLVLSLAHCKYISGRQINLLFYLPMINPNSILQSISFDLLKSLIVQVHPHLLLGGWHNGHLWASSSQLWNEVTKRKLPLEDNFFSGEEGFSKGADLKSQTAKVCLTTFSKPTIIMVRHLILNITVSPAVDGRSPEFYHLAHVHPGAELNVFGRLSFY